MIFLDASSILSEVIEANHQLIPVINRFGIKLGLEDKTIARVCQDSDINTDFFLTILNTYLNEDYFPERILQKFDIELVVDYLNRTDSYLINGQLYNLEKHMNAFLAMSDPNNSALKLIKKMFMKFKAELTIQVEQASHESYSCLALLSDLKSIIIKHISGNFNENMCYAIIFSIDSLQIDLQKHNRIREKVLQPMITELVDAGIDDWQEILSTNNKKEEDRNGHAISLRELDVLRLVAQGFLNKEIADKLNISMNTVLSHRKNITAKLGIKTVSGLIFYCITHGYISADEIEL